jgi:hypothetical protein
LFDFAAAGWTLSTDGGTGTILTRRRRRV